MQPSANNATPSVYSRDPQAPYIETPYISVVATARNDDHGGNLLGRMQVFIDAWINQAKRHRLSSELILVEWNPPRERERLAAALRWPPDTGPCQVRIIQVPPEVHARYRHAAALPLYQMIAKNVGIRRARGEFILATNIDIVFSDELMMFLSERRLEKSRMYRIDRTDVMSDVPVNGTVDEQLAYCRSHLIRVFAREGSFPLTADALRQNEAEDIVRPESDIHFGDGWFPVEKYQPTEPFRWIGNEAEVLARVPNGGAVLEIDLEAGLGMDRTPAVLQVMDGSGAPAGEFRINGRTKVGLMLPARRDGARQLFQLIVPEGGRPATNDHRILNFRVFRCDWACRPSQSSRPLALGIRQARPTLTRMLAGYRVGHGLGSMLLRGPGLCRRALRLLRARGEDIFEAGMEFWVGHGWSYLEHAGAERFRWVGGDGQLIIRTLDENRTLAMLVEPGPTVGYQPFVLVVRTGGGKVLAREPIQGLTYVQFPLPVTRGTLTTLCYSAEGGGEPVGGDARDLHFRVLACGTGDTADNSVKTAVTEPWSTFLLASEPRKGDFPAPTREIAAMGRPAFLHTYACGDFTLMSREHWFEVRGYAELDQFSMHVDSLLCYTAHHAGAKEEVLGAPLRIFHIEHGIGSGWTPEGEARLNARIAQKGIPSITYQDALWFIAQMRSLHAPIIFNLDDWGLASLDLSETQPSTAQFASKMGS
jgi:hypothetical protein